ncbi:MAG TPA: hypothetical protein ENI07_01130 [Desulfobacterales bacterium]|nr:hypothetical protein [Desulfobacterales bacterium]
MPAKGWSRKTGPNRVKTDHEEAIDQFIPEAEKYADAIIPGWREYQAGRGDWSLVFLDRMNELTIAAGLRVPFEKDVKRGPEAPKEAEDRIPRTIAHQSMGKT